MRATVVLLVFALAFFVVYLATRSGAVVDATGPMKMREAATTPPAPELVREAERVEASERASVAPVLTDSSANRVTALVAAWPNTDVGVIDFASVKFDGWPDILAIDDYLADPALNPSRREFSAEERAQLEAQLRARTARVHALAEDLVLEGNELAATKLASGDFVLPAPHSSKPAPGAFLLSNTGSDGITRDYQIRPGDSVGVDLAYRELQLQGTAALADVRTWLAAHGLADDE
ncbi:MAG: hypothetical protein K8S98_08785 [Planctomycetes bacterium]|nr:hypothetical protein [Planctomycetota bacterium]